MAPLHVGKSFIGARQVDQARDLWEVFGSELHRLERDAYRRGRVDAHLAQIAARIEAADADLLLQIVYEQRARRLEEEDYFARQPYVRFESSVFDDQATHERVYFSRPFDPTSWDAAEYIDTDTLTCRNCGCTNQHACFRNDGEGDLVTCSWIEPDLCSACLKPTDPSWTRPSDLQPGSVIWLHHPQLDRRRPWWRRLTRTRPS